MLYAAYVGDSLYMILRKYKDKYRIFFKSKEMSTGFNAPRSLRFIGGFNPIDSNFSKLNHLKRLILN